jgi:hypothetical protein
VLAHVVRLLPVAVQNWPMVSPSGRFSIRITSACLLLSRVRGLTTVLRRRRRLPFVIAVSADAPSALAMIWSVMSFD